MNRPASSVPPAVPLAGTVLAAAAAVLPPLAILAALGAAPLLGVLAVTLLLLDGRRAIAAARGFGPLPLMLGAIAFWGLVSVAWSILPLHSLTEACRFLAIAAGGLIVLGSVTTLDPKGRHRLAVGTVIGIGLAILLLLTERYTDGAIARLMARNPTLWVPLTRYDRGATILVLAAWPAIIALQQRPLPALALAAVTLFTVHAMFSTTAMLAMLLSLAVFAAAYFIPRIVAGAMMATLLVLAVAMPLALPDFRSVVTIHHDAPWLKFSAIHRLLIWRFTADRIAERPILGWGMDASRELPGGHLNLYQLLPDVGLTPDAEALPLHPHDALLQWRVELGVPGTALCLALIGWGLWRVGFAARLSPTQRAAGLAWSAAALPIAMLSFGIWQEWWLSCLWLTAGFAIGAEPRASAGDAG